MPRVGFFGDSYIDKFSPWTQYIQQLMPNHEFDVTGQGGSNLYYAIHQWLDREQRHGPDHYDVAVFTLTWPDRLFSVWPYRNARFCAASEYRSWQPDPAIQDDVTDQQFRHALPMYYQYIHDATWREFDWALEIQWIMNLARPDRHTRFIVIPNTEQARTVAHQHHRYGVLMDMAFETISNREPGSPGAMPIRDHRRLGHINAANHHAVARMLAHVIQHHAQLDSSVYAVDFGQFDVLPLPAAP